MKKKLVTLVVFALFIGACQPALTPTPVLKPIPVLTLTPRLTSTPRPTPICSEIKDTKSVSMCLVPAGSFTMGTNTSYGSDINLGDAGPAHAVSLDAFYIDKYEVTNALYKNCVDAGGCTLPGDVSKYNNSQYANHPVTFVDWDQATAYCAWRGPSTGSGQVRLPSEAEWEKAARGSTGDIYPWGDDDPNKDLANYGQNVGDTTAVGSYERGRSPFGVYDMAGNVWEWVDGWYAAYPGNTVDSPDYGTKYRVLRGGSWYYDWGYMRASFRNWGHSDTKSQYYGFRCARSAASQ